MIQTTKDPVDGSTCLDTVVTQSGLTSPDHCGWLLDLSNGLRRWCVIADMLFCVFRGRREEKPCNVIMLPGHSVRYICLCKDDICGKLGHSAIKPYSCNSSGVPHFQFVIGSPISGQEYKFGTYVEEDGDTWMNVLKTATSLDTTTASDMDLDLDMCRTAKASQEMVQDQSGIRNMEFTDYFIANNCTSKPPIPSSSSQGPTSHAAKHRRTRSADMNSFLPKEKVQKSSSESNEKSDAEPSMEPAFAKIIRHSSFNNVSELTRAEKNSSVELVGGTFRRIGSLNTVKCSSPLPIHPHAIPNQSPKAFFKRFRSRSSDQSRDVQKMNEPFTLKRSSSSFNPKGLGHVSGGKKLGSKLVRKASFIKDKMFGKSRSHDDSAKLGSLINVKVSGWLYHRHILKWSKVWCVVSDCHFYCFKTSNPKESADLHLPLTECSVRLVENEKHKKYTFSICHLEAKSTYLAAVDAFDFHQWIKALKRECQAWEGKCTHLAHRNSTDSTMSQASMESSESASSIPTLKTFQKVSSLIFNGEKVKKMKNGDENGNDVNIKDSNSCSSSSSSGFTEQSSCSVSSVQYDLPPPTEYCWMQKDLSRILVSPSSECSRVDGDGSTSDWIDSDSDFMENTTTDDETIPTPRGKLWCVGLRPHAASPRHDITLKQVWKRDKNYQLQKLKGRVAALPSRPSKDIFNRHLPGPNGEGLLLVGDDHDGQNSQKTPSKSCVDHEDSAFPTRNIHKLHKRKFQNQSKHHPKGVSSPSWDEDSPGRFSSSPHTSIGSPRIISSSPVLGSSFSSSQAESLPINCHSPVIGSSPTFGSPHYWQEPKQRRSMSDGQINELDKVLSPRQPEPKRPVRLPVAARDISQPAMAGYLDRKLDRNEWTSCWCVLKGDKLILYEAPIDDVSMETIHLPGYTIKIVPGQQNKMAFELSHPLHPTEVFSAESEDVQEVWVERLKRVTDRVTLEGLNLEEGRSREFDHLDQTTGSSAAEEWERDLLRQRKCKLLAALLKQKKEIERRQAHKIHEDISSTTLTQEETILPPPVEFGSNPDSDRVMKEFLKLKQKKISVQLKVDCIERQLQPTTSKVGKFQMKLKLPLHFGREKKSSDLISGMIESSGVDASNLEAQLDFMKTELVVINRRLEELQRNPLSRSTEVVFKTGSHGDANKAIPTYMGERPRSLTCGLERSLGKRGSDPFVDSKISLHSAMVSHEAEGSELVEPSVGRYEKNNNPKPAVPDMTALNVPRINTPTARSRPNGPATASITRGMKLTTQYGVKNCSSTPLRLRYSWSDIGVTKTGNCHQILSRTSSDGPANNPRLRQTLFSDSEEQSPRREEGRLNRSKSVSKEINPKALAQIAAFEELIQAKMST